MRVQISRPEIMCDECENVNWCPCYKDVIVGKTFDGKPHVVRTMVCRYCDSEIPGYAKDIEVSEMRVDDDN